MNVEVEENVVVLAEPGSEFMGHFAPQSGGSEDIFVELFSVCGEYDVDLTVVGCDGTNVNTGKHSGVIRRLEEAYQKPLHWFVCQIHGNELNLRHVFASLNGMTAGPKAFTGPIGKAAVTIQGAEAVAEFRPIPGQVQEIAPNIAANLSNDQLLLYRLALAVQSGSVPAEVVHRTPGPLNHAR